MTKTIAYLILCCILFSGCKCRLAKVSMPLVYGSIRESKQNDAFVSALQPKSSYLRLNGHNHYIDEAWLEHPYIQGNFQDTITKGFCLVISFHFNPDDSINLRKYIKQDGLWQDKISINLSDEEYKKDTFLLYYRESLDSAKKNKVLLLFKKRSN